jgi:hypothetical protein
MLPPALCCTHHYQVGRAYGPPHTGALCARTQRAALSAKDLTYQNLPQGPAAISRLTPEQYQVTQQNGTEPTSGNWQVRDGCVFRGLVHAPHYQ